MQKLSKTLIHFSLLAVCVCNASAVFSQEEKPPKTEMTPAKFTGEYLPETIPYKVRKILNSKLVPAWGISATSIPKTGDFTVDVDDRLNVRSFFNSIYLASPGTEMGFTGDVTNCTPGTTSALFKDAVLLRVNYFREMVGVPDVITFNAAFSAKAQQAALIMSANNSLSHDPIDDNFANCVTADGDEAAGASNLSLGNNGWNAVASQMRDNGSSNFVVGHRRWIIHPPSTTFGTGDMPEVASNLRDTNSLWVIDSSTHNNAAVPRDGYVAFPAPGYAPYEVVPPRWSFSIDDADFSSATVSMTSGGNPVSAVKETVSNGFGNNTMVWAVDGLDTSTSTTMWPKPDADTTYTVTIDNVMLSGNPTPQSYNYDVTIIDPAMAANDETETSISGPSTVTVNASAGFTFSSIPFAETYSLRNATLASITTEGAENGAGGVTDGTSTAYSLISPAFSNSGSNSFRLAIVTDSAVEDNFTSQFFVVEKDILLSANSTLNYSSRMVLALEGVTALTQISLDDGQSWIDVDTQDGTGIEFPGRNESDFIPYSISLSEYADRIIKIRFYYRYNQGMVTFGEDQSDSGLYVDDITVTNAQELTDIDTTTLGDVSSFNFTPTTLGDHLLQVQFFGWDGFAGSAFGPAKIITAQESTGEDTDEDGVDDDIDNCVDDPNPDQIDTDDDEIGDVCDSDDDNDGIPDSYETANGLNPLVDDAGGDDDGDGKTNLQEFLDGTNPQVNEAAVLLLILGGEE